MNATKVVLGAVGLYFLYEYLTTGSLFGSMFTSAGTAAAASTGASVLTTGQTTGQTPSTASVTAAQAQALLQQLVTAGVNDAHIQAQGGKGTYSQWCYYYQRIRGIACSFPSNYPTDSLMTAAQWLADAQAHGLSGLESGYAQGVYFRNKWGRA